jgi:hypothetical protein
MTLYSIYYNIFLNTFLFLNRIALEGELELPSKEVDSFRTKQWRTRLFLCYP